MSRRAVYSGIIVACVALTLLAARNGREPEVLSPRLPGDIPMPATPDKVSAKVLGTIGVAPTPRHFPKHDQADVRDMFDRTAAVAKVAVFIYQWSEPDFLKTAAQVMELSRQKGLTPILAISPTSLDKQRKELDVPAHLRGGLFSRPSFRHAAVQKEFIAAAETLARLKPPYLCLATEINFLALQRMDEFLHFAKCYKDAYRAVKRISPGTKVFVSFQYEFIRILDNKEPGKLQDHAKVIDIFRPELDVVAITSYPAGFYSAPKRIPVNYYTHISEYLRAGERLMIMEIGWPSGAPSTPAMQDQFVSLLPHLMANLRPIITAWSLLHDVRIPQFDSNLASTGLYTAEGLPKLALTRFSEISESNLSQIRTSQPR